MNTTENNKLIAEFMGLTQGKPNEDRWKEDWFTKDGRRFAFNELRYHTSWEWLMPVVEKIESLEFRFEIAYNEINLECMRPDLDRFSYHINIHNCIGYGEDLKISKIEATYKAVVEFIKWYNENK